MSKVLDAARIPSPSGIDENVARLVWRALCDPRGFCDGPELEVLGAGPKEVAALLRLLADTRVERWTGVSGTRYRDYVGQLPCGLLLRVTGAEPNGGDH